MEIYFGIFGVILGWLFGLLSPLVVSRITKQYKRIELQSIITIELRLLIVKLAASYFLLYLHIGKLTKEELHWVTDTIDKFDSQDIIEAKREMKKLLELPDRQYSDLMQRKKSQAGKFLTTKTFSLAYLQNKIDDLSIFGEDSQYKILSIISKIQILNEEIALSRSFSELTFHPEVTATNSAILESNIAKSYENIGEQCKDTAIQIEDLIDE